MKTNRSLAVVALSIILAVIAGGLAGVDHGIGGVPFVEIFDFIGQLFLNALTLVVVPLVAASIITGTARMGAENQFGRLGLKTLGYFILTSSLAILTGYLVVQWISPGIGQPLTVDAGAVGEKLKAVAQMAEESHFAKIAGVFLKLVPTNILAAAAQGQMIGLIPFCLLFGYLMMQIDSQLSSTLLSFWKGIFEVMMRMTQLVMKALPIGVFALVAKVVALSGFGAFQAVAWFFATVVCALAVYLFLVLPMMLKVISGVNPWLHFKAMFPALLTAFSTSSSAATLPVSIDCVERRVGVSNRICSFTLPLGASVNLSGTALYECVVVFFIAQAYGVELSLSNQFVVVFMALLTSMGMAGIPSASLIAIMIILQAVGLPVEAISLVLVVERILDMLRTTVNVFGSSCCALMIAHSEGERGFYPPLNVQQSIPGSVS